MEKPHSFFPSEAKKYGVNKAILLYNIRFWIDKNKSNEKNMHDGYYWTYNSSRAFSNLFPYMKAGSIKNWLKELEDEGVLKSGNYNKASYDKTKWYTIPAEYLIALSVPSSALEMQSNASTVPSSASGVPPIPDVTTDGNTDVTTDLEEAPEKKPSYICSLDALKEYAQEQAQENNWDEKAAIRSAVKAYETYKGNDWRNSKNRQVKNLKTTWLNNWTERLPQAPIKNPYDQAPKSYNELAQWEHENAELIATYNKQKNDRRV